MSRIHPLCAMHTHTHTHTHTHARAFNGPFSGTTWVSRYQKGKTNLDFTEARDSGWQWHQLGHMQVCIFHHLTAYRTLRFDSSTVRNEGTPLRNLVPYSKLKRKKQTKISIYLVKLSLQSWEFFVFLKHRVLVWTSVLSQLFLQLNYLTGFHLHTANVLQTFIDFYLFNMEDKE